MYSQILLKLHLKYKVPLEPVIVHYEVMNYSSGENMSDMAAKMSNSESLNFFYFLILKLFLHFFHRGGSSSSWKQDCGRSSNTGPG